MQAELLIFLALAAVRVQMIPWHLSTATGMNIRLCVRVRQQDEESWDRIVCWSSECVKPDIYSSFRLKQCCKTRQRPEIFSGVQGVFFKRRAVNVDRIVAFSTSLDFFGIFLDIKIKINTFRRVIYYRKDTSIKNYYYCKKKVFR